MVESVRWNEEIQANFRESIEENATIQMIAEIQSDVDQDNVNASAKKVETLLIKRAGGASTYKQTTHKTTKFPKKQKHRVKKAKKDFQENPANVITRDEFYQAKISTKN